MNHWSSLTISITEILMVMKTQLKVTYLPLIPSLPLFVTTNEPLLALRGQKPSPDLAAWRLWGAWNDCGANAGVVIKNLILSTWARPLWRSFDVECIFHTSVLVHSIRSRKPRPLKAMKALLTELPLLGRDRLKTQTRNVVHWCAAKFAFNRPPFVFETNTFSYTIKGLRVQEDTAYHLHRIRLGTASKAFLILSWLFREC